MHESAKSSNVLSIISMSVTMYTQLLSAVQLEDTQLIMIFLGVLIFGAVLGIIYMLFSWSREKRAIEERERKKTEQRRRTGRKKQRAIHKQPIPEEDEGDESYVVTLYDLLEVNRNADDPRIKKAYRQKCKQMHPDKTGCNDQKYITKLNLAKQTLLDPVERKKYDAFLRYREEQWITQMAGEVPQGELRIKIGGGRVPRLAPGEQVLKTRNEYLEWDGESE
jgi:hypothetical protein